MLLALTSLWTIRTLDSSCRYARPLATPKHISKRLGQSRCKLLFPETRPQSFTWILKFGHWKTWKNDGLDLMIQLVWHFQWMFDDQYARPFTKKDVWSVHMCKLYESLTVLYLFRAIQCGLHNPLSKYLYRSFGAMKMKKFEWSSLLKHTEDCLVKASIF